MQQSHGIILEMNGFRFFKSKSNPTISFQNLINWQFQNPNLILLKSELLPMVFCWRQNSPSTAFASWGKI